MAEEELGGAVTSQDRTDQLKVGWTHYQVQLDSTNLSWDKLNRKNKDIFSNTIPLNDILAIKAEEQSKPGQAATYFTVSYVTRHKNHKWTVSKATFQAQDQTICQEWVHDLKQAHSVAVQGSQRPTSLLVFVNPKSGGSKGEKIYHQHAAPLLQLASVKTNVIVTERPLHIIEYLKDCSLESIDGIALVGGDGTQSEVVNGLLQRQMLQAGKDFNDPDAEVESCSLRVGIIPAGTGQGHVMSATGTYDITTAVLHIIMGNSFLMDVVSVFNDGKLLRYSTLLNGYGFYGELIKYCETRRQYGRFRYAMGMAKGSSLMKYYNFDVYYLPADESSDLNEGEEIQQDGWRCVQGPFVALMAFELNIKTLQRNSDWNTVIIYTRPSFLGYMKTLVRMLKVREDAFDFDFVKTLDAKAYKTVNHPSELESNNATSSQTSVRGKMTWIVNLDGEYIPITHPETLYKFNTRNYLMFGTCPTLKEILEKRK